MKVLNSSLETNIKSLCSWPTGRIEELLIDKDERKTSSGLKVSAFRQRPAEKTELICGSVTVSSSQTSLINALNGSIFPSVKCRVGDKFPPIVSMYPEYSATLEPLTPNIKKLSAVFIVPLTPIGFERKSSPRVLSHSG